MDTISFPTVALMVLALIVALLFHALILYLLFTRRIRSRRVHWTKFAPLWDSVSNLEEKFDKLASDFLDNISDIAALREQLQVPAPGPSIVVVGLQDVWKKWHKDECANFEHWEVTAADGVTAKVFTGLSPVVAEVAFTEFINAIKPGDRYRIRFYQRPDPSSSYTEKKTFQFEL